MKNLVSIKNESIVALEEEVAILRREDAERTAETNKQLKSSAEEQEKL